MTTPCRILAVAAAVFLRAGASGAETNESPATAGAAFATVRAEVLAAPSGVLTRDGFVFCVGRALSDPAHGTAVGEDKARLVAAARLSGFVRDASPWPEGTPDNDRDLAWTLFLADHPLGISESGAEQVLSERPGEDRFLAVVAFSKEAVLAARPDASALADALGHLRVLREAGSASDVPAAAASAVPEWIEPRGLMETNGATLNETLFESLL